MGVNDHHSSCLHNLYSFEHINAFTSSSRHSMVLPVDSIRWNTLVDFRGRFVWILGQHLQEQVFDGNSLINPDVDKHS